MVAPVGTANYYRNQPSCPEATDSFDCRTFNIYTNLDENPDPIPNSGNQATFYVHYNSDSGVETTI